MPLPVGVSAFYAAKIGGTNIGLYRCLSVTELDSHANMAVAGGGCTIIAIRVANMPTSHSFLLNFLRSRK